MKTREELDVEWQRIDDAVTEVDKPADKTGKPFAEWLRETVAAERAFVDRAAQALAIRWLADPTNAHAHEYDLAHLADRIERGKVTIPEEP